ncbi:MAG TPA: hypothetical protein VGF16_10630 [Bryobacteraceae bacterium]
MSNVQILRPWRWVIGGLAAVLVLAGLGVAATPFLATMIRGRIIGLLQRHYGAQLQVRRLDVTLFPVIEITGDDLVLRQNDRPEAPPLISVHKFATSTNLIEMIAAPPRVHRLILEGLQIQVSRRHKMNQEPEKPRTKKVPDFIIDTVEANGAVVTVIPADPRKEPLQFLLKRLRLTSSGTARPMSFRALLTNAKPPGDIRTTGRFGPWNQRDPDQTPVQGEYTFQDADLSVFRGILGTLSSNGGYHGVLERIEVDGKTDVPDFALKISRNPVHLKTQFHAVVDGTDGDTLLEPVQARFGTAVVNARGGVEGKPGTHGKTVRLDVDASGQLADMLRLGVKGQRAPMSGDIRFQTTLIVPPGDVDIAQKLQLNGRFQIASAHFSQLSIQEKVNSLSHAGEGHPRKSKTEIVASDFAGRFGLDQGVMAFRNLSFCVPGVDVRLQGRYGLLDERLDFRGKARLEAELSDTTTGWKSLLLKAVNPFFKKDAAGAVVPFTVTGTRDDPDFGLDLHSRARKERHR